MAAPLPLIHNPAAGGGRGSARFRQAQALLRVAGILVESRPTRRPRHAAELARELAVEGRGVILVMGGDGTVSEAASGLLALPAEQRPTLGCLPGGTGNDFLRDFGILDLASAVERIRAGNVRAVDAVDVRWDGAGGGRATSINVVGTGVMARAGWRCNRGWKWLGRWGYDACAVIELLRTGASPTRLVLDGRDASGDHRLVVCCNSRGTGGAMTMAPDARPDDGLLDVVTAEGAGRLELLRLLATKLRQGLHVRHPRVLVRKAARVEIGASGPSPLLIDGEIMGQAPVRLEVLPRALRVLA